MAYDYSKLLGKIREVCGTQAIFANKIGWSEHTCSMKLSNRVAWKQPEIHKAVKILGLKDGDIQAYFFTLRVQDN